MSKGSLQVFDEMRREASAAAVAKGRLDYLAPKLRAYLAGAPEASNRDAIAAAFTAGWVAAGGHEPGTRDGGEYVPAPNARQDTKEDDRG